MSAYRLTYLTNDRQIEQTYEGGPTAYDAVQSFRQKYPYYDVMFVVKIENNNGSKSY